MCNWNRIQTLELIKLYEQNPILYKTPTNVLTCMRKKQTLHKITFKLQAVKPNVTADVVKSKIKTLRNQYIREKHALALAKTINEIYEPIFWCFDELYFLDKFVSINPTNIPQPNESLPNQSHSTGYTLGDADVTKDSAEIVVEDDTPINNLSKMDDSFPPTMNRVPHLSSWSREQTCVLLNELQNYPMIYDQSHPFYQNRAQRLTSLRMIVAKLKPIKPNITPELISKKIKCLRTQFYKEKRLKENPLENLSGNPNETGHYRPKLWCYGMLQFLDKRSSYTTIKPRCTTALREEQQKVCSSEVQDNVIVDDSNESSDHFNQFEEVEMDEVEFQKNTKTESEERTSGRSVLHDKCLKLVETLSKEMKTINADSSNFNEAVSCNKQSPQTFLGLMVESELSTVSEGIYHDAKWKIIRILEEAATKERELKLRQGQINLHLQSPSSSSTSSSYNLSEETRVTVMGDPMFKTPIYSTPRLCSKVKVMEINRFNESK